MKSLLFSSALLAGLLLAAAPAWAEVYPVYVYTGGIPAWWTWYGYPANMTYYYGPAPRVVAPRMVTVAVPLQTVQVAVPTAPVLTTANVVVTNEPPAVKKEIVVKKTTPALQTVALNKDRAVIRVLVPANARLYFEGMPMKQKGAERVFLSPLMERGQMLTYTVKATWVQNGKEMSRRETVEVRPGQDVTVNLHKNHEALDESRLEVLPRP